MINAGMSNITGCVMAIMTPDEQAAALKVNGQAIEWLEQVERDASKELKALRKHLELRRRLQGYYQENKPMLESMCEYACRMMRDDWVEVVRSGVIAFPVCRMFSKNGPVNEHRETYSEPSPGYGSESVSEKKPVDNAPGGTL